MGVLPEIVGRDEFAALIIRTDYGDESAWQAVVAELTRPWGDGGEYEAQVHLVDDRVWGGVTSDEVLDAVRRDEELSVVFLADRVTMQSAHRALLALTPSDEDEDLDPMYYQELIDSPPPREFRTVPVGVHEIHGNLLIGNMDFEEFAEVAFADPEGVFRSF
ncbi:MULTISPECIES: DUF6924 domain-containing protein [Streptomyces]|uniref:DUF6924 domain-containing protein n=1 Tax=Streptomyces dengpaensis TaxID=2049881 RepID=A0ABN5I0Z7_9ACTN|nr:MULTISPECIES: hypothetical protein [Streptomyces]AVH56910.1 hypothetical protein C4B68_15210 [Streptomyces dengpaensis]PIB04741.1 hypothetical protein B1C81_31805 [Streptomyces sp. HG99]